MKKFIAALCVLFLSAAVVFTIGAQAQPQSPANISSPKMYGIGSVSKVVTAAAVMKLVEDGRLNLDDPLTAYIPDFTMADARYADITPRMLLNHSSGFMGMTDNNAFLIGDNDTYNHDNFLGLIKAQTLKHTPGDRSVYSNDSFTLAEILVERVSGVSFTEFIEREFTEPLGIKNIKTPQSDFDRAALADTYLGNNKLKPQNLNLIGSGGIYATLEDLCRFGAIFTDGADGSVLSRESTGEMAKVQHKMEMVPQDADTTFRYGLGWDCVEQYPFNKLGIKALSKGGATGVYDTNLTVLPEYNIVAAVSSSGAGGMEPLIAQEIILAVLEEEGLIPAGTSIDAPAQNLGRAEIPDGIRSYAGLYDMGIMGLYNVEFSKDVMRLKPVGVRNERAIEFIYNTDGEFVSINGDSLGANAVLSLESNARGVTALTFAEDGKYIVIQSYEDIPELSKTASAMPIGERMEANPVSFSAQNAWDARNGKEYLLVSDKHTSGGYLKMRAVVKTLTDERFPGYVRHGVYDAGGFSFSAVRITDENTALGYQSIPTMTGRDTVNLSAEVINGIEYLYVNNYRYIDAAAAVPFSELGESVVIGAEPVWVNIDDGSAGNIINVSALVNGSWFVYNDKMNCIASSLEKDARNVIILPENGRIVLCGE